MIAFIRVLLIFTCLTSCQKKENSTSSQLNTKLLRISTTSINSFDPRKEITHPTVLILKMLFEGLMRIGPSGTVEPAIAENVEISEDGLTYLFHLRDAKWSNGDPITAYDFASSWKQVIDPKSCSLGVENFYCILNVEDIVKNEKPVDSVGICVLDAKTLEVRLEYPAPYFLEVTATAPFFPVNQQIDHKNPNWCTQTGDAFVCNGPFHLESYQIENEIIMKKNPLYWDETNIHLPGIHIAIIKDNTTQLSLFEKKQLDFFGAPLNHFPLEAFEYWQKKAKIYFKNVLGIRFFSFNTDAFPFQNKKMRQAFSYAIDRQSIVKHILNQGETIACSLLSGQLATQEKPFFQDNNKQLARKLFQEALEELGIKKDNISEITLMYGLKSPCLPEIQKQWNETFDLNVKLEFQDTKYFLQRVKNKDFQIVYAGWVSWLRDPIYTMQTFLKKDATVNLTNWENKEYQHFVHLAKKEINPELRKTFFNKAEAIFMEEMPIIPLYFNTSTYMKSDKLQHEYTSELFDIDFRWATLDD